MSTVASQRAARIYLAGFMGSGKTTIGPILANTIGYSFIDLDAAIEETSGRPIGALFRESGENAFRELEQATLRDISVREKVVVALGGGALTDPGSFTLASTSGILVYLEASLDDIFARVRKKSDRPLLMSAEGTPLGEDELRKRIGSLLVAREPIYRRADIIVNTDGTKLGITVDLIVKKLAPFLPR